MSSSRPPVAASASMPSASTSAQTVSTGLGPAATSSGAPTGPMASDPRVHFDQRKQKWCFEDDDGKEMEYDEHRHSWVPVLEDDLVSKQQAAYSVEGVDENTPAAPVLAREHKKRKKNHQDDDEDEDTQPEASASSSSKRQARSTNNGNTTRAIFVTQLPPTTTVDQLQSTFSKAGLIMEDADGQPRIKLYKDDATGHFKGEALIVYLQDASVELATRLFDETELVLGSGQGVMKVKKAEWTKDQSHPGSRQTEQANGDRPKGGQDEQRRQKQKKRTEKLRQKLTDWSSSDDEATAQAKARARLNPRIVVLQGMFTLNELEQDPALLLDLKEDVREECETLGEVTNVTLYDQEPTGILTVRFKDELPAKACIAKMNGRYFGGRQVRAFYLDSSVKYKKSGQGVDLAGTGLGDHHEEQEAHDREQERLRKYAEWLEKGGADGESEQAVASSSENVHGA
ncbi:hypothetical protein OIO90_006470 [Microbotryomycetes sp. JL221]|nr:hypothetical protein OIO90_006470 [Microbotryomycetes sp. JL221]